MQVSAGAHKVVDRISNTESCDSVIRVSGIAPLNSFSERSNLWSLVRSPSSAGIVPLKSLEARASSVTRPFWSVVTPCQSQSDTKGASLNQFVFVFQFAPFVPL